MTLALFTLVHKVLGANKGAVFNDVMALVGKDASLPCAINKATCGDFHSIKWYKGNQRVFVYSPVASFSKAEGELLERTQLDVDDNIAHLKISPVLTTDEGEYKCQVTFLDMSTNCPSVQRVKLTTLVDCLDKNIDYPGNDINLDNAKSSHKRPTALECQDLCSKTRDCQFFTWAPNHHCYLKSSKSGKTYENAAISGPKSCKGTPEALALAIPNSVAAAKMATTTIPSTPTACVETIDQDTDYTGEDLFKYVNGVVVENSNNIEAESIEECRDICRATYRCKYWTFVKNWRVKCVLKYSREEKIGGVAGKVSGNVCKG